MDIFQQMSEFSFRDLEEFLFRELQNTFGDILKETLYEIDRRIKAVSYTHLDVYKRQLPSCDKLYTTIALPC